jgi:hypothetical protein
MAAPPAAPTAPADQGTFEAASTLIADDAADGGSAEAADDRATLGVGA